MGVPAHNSRHRSGQSLPQVAIWDSCLGDVAYQAVEPGLVDSRAIYAYTNGQCAALAVALHDICGGDIYMTVARSGDIYHVGAATAPGMITDIYGWHSAREWIADRRFYDPLDPIVQVERISRQRALSLPRFLPQSVEVARSFAQLLLGLRRDCQTLF